MEKDLPEGFETRFWKLVLLVNVGSVSLAFGVMYLFFEGWSDVAFGALAVGGVSVLFAVRSYFLTRGMLSEHSQEPDTEPTDS